MDSEFDPNLTDVIRRASEGDAAATNLLFETLYERLRERAHSLMRGQAKHASLWATGLVHDAYLKLFSSPGSTWESRRHFLAVAAKAMRSVLVDHARKRSARKRSTPGEREPIDLVLDDFESRMLGARLDILALAEALDELEQDNERAAQVVHLRFFLGMSEPQVAAALEVGERTVQRDWAYARAKLAKRLK